MDKFDDFDTIIFISNLCYARSIELKNNT